MSTKLSVLVPLAEGFEEIEAITIVDVLRRAGINVITASLGNQTVKGAHGIEIVADRVRDGVKSESVAMIARAGG
jgi:4-methyl-5(b-hydroxyethyl)-thiazole monophosphate biosynthesis